MAADDFEHGLFEDSEGSASEEALPSHFTTVEDTQEELDAADAADAAVPEPPKPVKNEVVHKSIACAAYPMRDHHLIICKLPPAVSMASSPFNEMEERQRMMDNPKLLEDPSSCDVSSMIRWRFKPVEEGSTEPFGLLETNTHLVEWDDGTLTLFIGKTPLTVDCRSETVFLLEDSRQDMKPVHAVITERMLMKFANIPRSKFTKSKEQDAKRQKMTLTSIADAVSSEISLQKRRLLMRENERMRRIQQHSMYQPRGLTRQFLEGEDMQ
ncbi:hypothetical protein BgAZ_106600 [Babesia gibsoni]|uniref:Leo1-like protein n=1 Tax=Babesia gibsoni TaxID=33632 RepID=A0AAD8PG70_BABGI|nr:hypothetical protein BgAZ_106600 [Babesia gibsoni]